MWQGDFRQMLNQSTIYPSSALVESDLVFNTLETFTFSVSFMNITMMIAMACVIYFINNKITKQASHISERFKEAQEQMHEEMEEMEKVHRQEPSEGFKIEVKNLPSSRKKVIVKEAFNKDRGRARIRIDPKIIRALNLKQWEVIEIFHPLTKKSTAAYLFPGKIKDRGSNAIRIDQSTVRNLSAYLDEEVEIFKIDTKLAEWVIFAGYKVQITLRDPGKLAMMLEGRIITKGDILGFKAMEKRIDFIVIDFFPDVRAVKIHLDTKIIMSEQSYKEKIEID
jgi:hypothetical protein